MDAYTRGAGVLFDNDIITSQNKELLLDLMVRSEHDSHFLIDDLVRTAVVAVENKGVFRFACTTSA
jgi:hypothetical protein